MRPRLLSALERLYAAVLRVYPLALRKQFGREMLEAFRDSCATMRAQHGLGGLLVHGMRGIAELLYEGLRARVTHRRTGRRALRVGSFGQDTRYAWRTLAKAPGFTAVVVVVLALGIGTNVAMFHTVYAALVKPLPYPGADRLVMGRATFGGEINPWASGADYLDYRERGEVFDDLAAILPFAADYTITGGDRPERAAGTVVAVNLFPTLGVNPQLGRHFSPAEGLADGPDAMIISHG